MPFAGLSVIANHIRKGLRMAINDKEVWDSMQDSLHFRAKKELREERFGEMMNDKYVDFTSTAEGEEHDRFMKEYDMAKEKEMMFRQLLCEAEFIINNLMPKVLDRPMWDRFEAWKEAKDNV